MKNIYAQLTPVNVPEEERLSWDQALAAAEARMAELAAQRGFTWRNRWLSPIGTSTDYSTIKSDLRSILSSANPNTALWIHPRTGELVHFKPPGGDAAGDTLTAWLVALHFGSVWGRPHQVFVSLCGLFMVVLSVTGVILWWRKRQSYKPPISRSRPRGRLTYGTTNGRSNHVFCHQGRYACPHAITVLRYGTARCLGRELVVGRVVGLRDRRPPRSNVMAAERAPVAATRDARRAALATELSTSTPTQPVWPVGRQVDASMEHLEVHLCPRRPTNTDSSRTIAPASFAAPTVRSVSVVLGDGEATFDSGVVKTVIERLPMLQGVTLVAPAAVHPKTYALAKEIRTRCTARGIAFAVDFALVADADAFSALVTAQRGTPPDGMAAILIASRRLRERGMPVRWLVPVTRALVYRLEPLFSLARDEGVEPVLVPPWFAANVGWAYEPALDQDERLFVNDFIAFRLLKEEFRLQPLAYRVWYDRLRRAIDTTGTIAAKEVAIVGVLAPTIDSAGATGWSFAVERRPHDGRECEELRIPSAATPGDGGASLRSHARDVRSVLLEGSLALAQRLRSGLREITRPTGHGALPQRLPTVLLVGAYGGDHIGDTAILGGVLIRLHRRYGTTRAIVMSQRAAHTGHLVPMLDTPIALEVDAYELANVRSRMRDVDAVVFAGGPLIDLPKQLVKHFYAASLASTHGKPFIMEGIGPGPFPRWPSAWTARRLVRMAARISVRNATDVNDPLLHGISAEPGHDPAFDYLATRTGPLSKLRPDDEAWIDRLLEQTDGRVLIGINLRPIRHLFTLGAPPGQRAEYTRRIESQCEQNLAAGMLRFQQACTVKPCFVFFPMNAIQFGSSDLRSAYRLRRLLDPDVDFRVWQGDAGLDGVVALLRKLDIAITMRFHATIFALSQKCQVISIDYRIGKQYKVGVLMTEVGQEENCRRIDELTGEWLSARLEALASVSCRG